MPVWISCWAMSRGGVDRDGESNPDAAALSVPPRDAIAEFTPITAPDASTRGPPELPGLIGGVRLDRVDDRVRVAAITGEMYRAVDRGDYAGRHRAPQPQRRADGNDRITDRDLGRVAQAGDREVGTGDLEHGEVGKRSRPTIFAGSLARSL